MVRLCALAAATLLLALPSLAHGQTTTTSATDPATCAEPADATGTTTTVAFADGSSSGGTPAGITDSDPASVVPAGGGDVPIGVSDAPVATVAQEPEPDPESGEEQPGDPGGEPQPPTGDEPVEVPGDEAPATGGGLPRTGLEALKLALLGFVLLLVGARLRVVIKRRQVPPAAVAADGLPHDAPAVSAMDAEEPEDEYVDEDEDVTEVRDGWSFPDPDEPAPTGLLPSTAMARRQAREQERLT